MHGSFSSGSRRRRRRLLPVAVLLGLALAGFVPAAQAAITPTGALAIAQAIASPSATVTGASFVAQPGGTPNGVSTTALTGFPTDGSSFGVLTSGNVGVVGSPATFANTNDGGGNVRGNTDMDVSILKIDLSVPSTANCLTFDFRFLSEEYPGYVATQFNDAFIAELDSSTWTTSGSTISAPNNFAFDSSNNVVSINSTGLGGMSAARGAGTAFDGGTTYSADLGFSPPNGDGPAGGATVLLHASHQVTPGAHSLFLSIFDQGDQILDSAVFLDNLVVGFVPNPGVNCVPGAQPVNFKLALTPATASNPTGTPHTVTATLTDIANNPVGSAPIEFTVTGPNATTGTSTTNASGQATFTYTGANQGTDLISACYKDGAPICLAVATVSKTWTDPLITAAGKTINATEGLPFSGPVATFVDPDLSATAAEYAATINWGDGSPLSAGTITGGSGNFTVAGTHTYAEEGPPLPVTVTITDIDTPSNTATAHSTANVADAPLTASGMSLLSGPTYAGPVATFTDANSLSTTADFTATIDWGDGSPPTSGTVTGSLGSYTVNGIHTYASLGSFTIKVHIVDDGGSTADATSTILIFATSSGGNFVIGDGNAAVGTNVTFWGAQWWKRNTLSGGTAPAAFKGFESSPSSGVACGIDWSTDPGSSPPPPPGPLPAFMAVLVSSSVSKSGSTISGNTPHVVIVQTNPGYAANAGHAGTGTVVATLC
jgi:Bacterial Ig-like domain (group 1)